MNNSSQSRFSAIISIPVIVAALGYFVDIYDLVLFSIVRIPSLKEIGLSGDDLTDKGLFLLNVQMGGMLLGGIVWGILGDKKGRLSVLFGSIFLYSIANIANGFAHSIESYTLWRFIAGLGLAGELGAGITLVSEVLSKENRGYGTMVVASVGISGAILANIIAHQFNWRTAYFFGGGLGLMLLILRIGVFESGMFSKLKEQNVKRGVFLTLFKSKERFLKYTFCILIGVPIWYVIGILITLAPEFSKDLNIIDHANSINAGDAIMYSYMGLVAGDMLSGLFSQLLKSRRKAVLIFLILTAVFVALYFCLRNATSFQFYSVCFALGFASGYWAVFVTIAAEQFGTNLRATVATTVPNFVRGSVIPITLLFQFFRSDFGNIVSAAIVGALCLLLSLLSLWGLKETFGKELNYVENI